MGHGRKLTSLRWSFTATTAAERALIIQGERLKHALYEIYPYCIASRQKLVDFSSLVENNSCLCLWPPGQNWGISNIVVFEQVGLFGQ